MRTYILFCFMILSGVLNAKEWKNLRVFQKITQKENLSPSDWLISDRIHNTQVWQLANAYNLQNNLPNEYLRIKERRDFYKWLCDEVLEQGHGVVWITMAYFISLKLHLMESFPYTIGFSKKTLECVWEASESVFNNAFLELRDLYRSNRSLGSHASLEWDKNMLYKEQYVWVAKIYGKINAKSLKTVERIAKGKFPFGLIVPNKIRFQGNISDAKTRYDYALNTLRNYCENRYKE